MHFKDVGDIYFISVRCFKENLCKTLLKEILLTSLFEMSLCDVQE